MQTVGVGLHKKLIAVLMTAFLAFGITGCDAKENSSSVVDSFEPVNIPEGGWTVESIAKTIRINGKELPEPFTCENLGEGYSLKIDDKGYIFLYYKNKCVAQTLYKEESKDIDNSKELFMISVIDGLCKDKNFISFNGIHLGSTRAEAERALGKPTVEYESEYSILWNFSVNGTDDEKNYLVLVFEPDEKLSVIAFYFM